MNHTQNLHLPQWEASDRIHHEDFNEAMIKIDAQIKSAKDAASALQSAMPRIAVGSYTGSGQSGSSHKTTLSFGFPAKAVLIVNKTANGADGMLFAVSGQTTCCSCGSNGSAGCTCAFSGNSFTMYSTASSNAAYYQFNTANTQYYYCAIG